MVPVEESKLRRIASIGECMIELSPAPELGSGVLRRGFAGDTLNTAVYLARCLRRMPQLVVRHAGRQPDG